MTYRATMGAMISIAVIGGFMTSERRARFADILEKMGHVMFVSFFIPLFFGDRSVIIAACGALAALLSWTVSLYFTSRS